MNTKVDEGKLISGKEALIALANGEEVQWMNGERFQDVTDQWQLCEFSHPSFKFRLKPQTIAINGIEVPAPFEPKEGDLYWHISPEYMIGYGTSMYSDGNVDTWQQFGAWRTEEEIKQVVAALRQVFGGSHDN